MLNIIILLQNRSDLSLSPPIYLYIFIDEFILNVEPNTQVSDDIYSFPYGQVRCLSSGSGSGQNLCCSVKSGGRKKQQQKETTWSAQLQRPLN